MSLKRYLLATYLITVAILIALALIMAVSDENVPWKGLLIMAPFIALANVGVNIFPWAIMVPRERRTSFWSYRWTNIFLGSVAALTLALAVFAVVGL